MPVDMSYFIQAWGYTEAELKLPCGNVAFYINSMPKMVRGLLLLGYCVPRLSGPALLLLDPTVF